MFAQAALKEELNASVCVKYANFLYSQANYEDAVMYLEDSLKSQGEEDIDYTLFIPRPWVHALYAMPWVYTVHLASHSVCLTFHLVMLSPRFVHVAHLKDEFYLKSQILSFKASALCGQCFDADCW